MRFRCPPCTSFTSGSSGSSRRRKRKGRCSTIWGWCRGECSLCRPPSELRPLAFDVHQREEILLTILQSFLGFLLLVNMELRFHEALILFVFWFAQFVMPSWRHVMIYVYLGWCIVELVRMIAARSAPAAWTALRTTLRQRFA